ncbi:MAG: MFS transporter [Anaerolineales bacterium]|nr:MFS transporter [Anaerolineales bacterium]
MATSPLTWGRSAWHWLLQLDKPAPPRTDLELEVEAEAHYNWNFTVNVLDGALFWFGASFISSTTILPLFVSKLTTDPFWFALLAVLAQASWYLPQLFTAGWTEQLARKKPVIVNLGFFTERVPLWLLPVAALLALRAPAFALLLFFFAYAWHGFGAGAVATAWSDMVARVFPVRKRGWFFGFSAFIGTGLGAIGAFFSSWLLEAYPYPVNFAWAFAIAALAITVSWVFLAFTREPAQPAPAHIKAQKGNSWRKIRGVVKEDRNFRNFLWSRFLLNMGRMGAGFLTVAAVEQFNVADSTVGIYTAVLLVGQTLGNLLAGVVADRRGHKLSLAIGSLASALSFAMAWLATAAWWYYGVFLLTGFANGMLVVSGVLVVMEFHAPKIGRPISASGTQ